jgi:glutaconate CoA-transferase subunit B
MAVTSLHPGITRRQVRQNTGWEVRFAETVVETEPPSAGELEVLRELHARTARAHGAAAGGE